jgi:hypothetical protein
MKLKLLILLLILSSSVYSQETIEVYPIDDFFEDYFEFRELNLILKYNDPNSDNVIYTVNGNNLIQGIDPKILFLHETYPKHDKITIQTRFSTDEFRSIKKRYDLINEWSTPSYPASIYWDSKRDIFVLTVSIIVFSKSKTVSFARIDDLYLGFIAALKDLNNSLKIKL